MFSTALQKLVRSIVIMAPAIALVFCAAPVNAATAPAIVKPKICLPVDLTAVGQDLGPDEQGILHTTSTVFIANFPVARTYASFTPTGLSADNVLSFTGPIVFSTHPGAPTLTATVQGKVDLATGEFSATSTSVTGTGVLKGVSGSLVFHGTEDPTKKFTETIGGTLCSKVRPW